jgi:hypothetical protein
LCSAFAIAVGEVSTPVTSSPRVDAIRDVFPGPAADVEDRVDQSARFGQAEERRLGSAHVPRRRTRVHRVEVMVLPRTHSVRPTLRDIRVCHVPFATTAPRARDEQLGVISVDRGVEVPLRTSWSAQAVSSEHVGLQLELLDLHRFASGVVYRLRRPLRMTHVSLGHPAAA